MDHIPGWVIKFLEKICPEHLLEEIEGDLFERATLTITSLFTGLAICIACLGLFGLSAYVIESRLKEIGHPESFRRNCD